MRLSHQPSRLSPPPGSSMHELVAASSAAAHSLHNHNGGHDGGRAGRHHGYIHHGGHDGHDGHDSREYEHRGREHDREREDDREAEYEHERTGDGGGGGGGGESAAGGAGTAAGSKRKDEDRVPKRGYRACVHCRLRKAKCDLGDVNAPSEPPCTRCRREQRNCVFLPSKRRRKTANDDIKPEVYPVSGADPLDAGGAYGGTISGGRPQMPDDVHSFAPPLRAAAGGGRGRPAEDGYGAQHWGDRPRSANSAADPPHLSPLFDQTTPLGTASSLASGSASSPSNSRKRRHREPDATRRIVVASFSNETDALEILAKAATDADGEPADRGGEPREGGKTKRVAFAAVGEHHSLSDFILVKRGVLNEHRLELLANVFFTHHHAVLPVVQTLRIPHNTAQLAAFAHDDPFLLCAIVCVASRHHPDVGMKEVHEKTYALVRETLTDYACAGLQPTTGFVEGVLLLAENPPRERLSSTAAEMTGPTTEGRGLHGSENRRSWALTGTAIRAAYGIGLDQISLEDGPGRDPHIERCRATWTWCYLFDRALGLRTGLAFWSRGPALCFQGISDINQTGEAAARLNFPYMLQQADTPSTNAPSPQGPVDTNDSASSLQAQIELTQIMTNAHDILFSTPTRTSQLVRKGEYFKFLDHFRRALDSFKCAWADKVWHLDSVRELTWCTFHFVRLYVAAFAFQAHVQRAAERAEQDREQGRPGVTTIFPRGSATSPDALFIWESIEASHEILSICLRLGHAGVLRYLPSRYLINFAYSGTFALKAAYSGAVGKADIVKTTELVERVCAALLLACPDQDHAAYRYGTMLRLLTRRLTELSDQSAVPSRFQSPEPSATPDNLGGVGGGGANGGAGGMGAGLGSGMLGMMDMGAGAAAGGALHGLPLADVATGATNNLFDLSQVPGANLFDAELNIGFNLEGFWDDFTLTDSGGFPFR